jgi:sigma-B regulation protein RsbU (phosphoserine phosphatase)
MPRIREAVQRLGKSGVAFLGSLVLYFALYFSNHGVLAFFALLALIVLAIILAVRALRFTRRHLLWSVRNRLLFVYGLMGALPILLLFVLIGLSAWGLTNEVAIYLASTALERRLDPINGVVESLSRMTPEQRSEAAAEMQLAFRRGFPGISFYIDDEDGARRYPPASPPLDMPSGWKDASGLLVWKGHFYGWAHRVRGNVQVTALAPLSDDFVEGLVPNLGVIALIEPAEKRAGHPLASAGSVRAVDNGSSKDPDFDFVAGSSTESGNPRRGRVPPAMGAFDFPVFLPSTVPHYHLDTPNRTYDGYLWVHSRTSAVLTTFFSKAEFLRGYLSTLFIVVAVLFLLVELVAVIIGVSLSHRLTGAVHEIYEGTRRVLLGDFRHRIPVRAGDQLGELGQSFNQMTGNLERLFAVEKEKERLQAELEIAREVQYQLYPKNAAPIRGLKLTAQCDPARMVSGDYYDYQETACGKLAFAIGDVAGKGISAALLMATLQAALRAQISGEVPEIDASQVVSKLNQQIYAHTSPEKYATFFFAMFDQQSRKLTYTNAGHLSPLLFRNGSVVPLDSNGTVVGAFPFSQYDKSSMTLSADDLLVCYTDGITEPENAYGEMFGEERLIELVQKHAHDQDHEIIRIVLDAVRSWTGTPELQDDMTLLLAREMQTA